MTSDGTSPAACPGGARPVRWTARRCRLHRHRSQRYDTKRVCCAVGEEARYRRGLWHGRATNRRGTALSAQAFCTMCLSPNCAQEQQWHHGTMSQLRNQTRTSSAQSSINMNTPGAARQTCSAQAVERGGRPGAALQGSLGHAPATLASKPLICAKPTSRALPTEMYSLYLMTAPRKMALYPPKTSSEMWKARVALDTPPRVIVNSLFHTSCTPGPPRLLFWRRLTRQGARKLLHAGSCQVTQTTTA